MAQDRDQYVHFTIKLLKGSFALNALWQDALNYHMIDQPDKLIALRLTEYYEMVSKGATRPGPGQVGVQPAPVASPPTPTPMVNNVVPPSPSSSAITRSVQPQPQPAPERPKGPDIIVTASLSAAEENAEEAADYWSPL